MVSSAHALRTDQATLTSVTAGYTVGGVLIEYGAACTLAAALAQEEGEPFRLQSTLGFGSSALFLGIVNVFLASASVASGVGDIPKTRPARMVLCRSA